MIRLLHRLCQGIASRSRNLVYRLLGVDFRDYCWLRGIEIPQPVGGRAASRLLAGPRRRLALQWRATTGQD